MDIFRLTARWTGFSGAPGFSNFYFAAGTLDGGILGDVAQDAGDNLITAFAGLQSVLPTGVSISIESEVAVLNSETGEVLDYEQINVTGRSDGTAAGGYAGPTGAVINWRTNDVRFGRRIRGRTFLVPLASTAFDGQGSLSAGALADVQEFADDVRAGFVGAEFGVWSRPRQGAGGVFATVTSHNVPDLAAVLRSRRD